MKTKHVDMLSGSVMRGLFTMAVPVMIMNVAASLFNLADSAALKAFGHGTAVGAVSAAGTLQTVFTCLVTGLAAGASVVIARHLGAKERRRAEEAASTALLLAVGLGLFLLVVGCFSARTLLVLMNCKGTLLEEATTYMRIYFLGAPFLALSSFSSAALRSIGDTRRPMYILFIGCILKLVLTVTFLSISDKGVESVALATLVTFLVKAVLTLGALVRSREALTVDLRHMTFRMSELRATLYNGLPPAAQTALYSLANVVIISAVNLFGPDATTGVGIANQYDGIIYQLVCAPSVAAIPYVAQNIGAGDSRRAKRAILCAMLITIGFGASLGSFSAIFAPQLSGLLATTTAARDYAVQKMIIISSTYFICGINEVVGGALKGMGRPISPMIANLIYLCGLRFIWVYAIFPLVPNLTFLYLVWPISWACSIVTLLPFLSHALRSLGRKRAAAAEGAASQ